MGVSSYYNTSYGAVLKYNKRSSLVFSFVNKLVRRRSVKTTTADDDDDDNNNRADLRKIKVLVVMGDGGGWCIGMGDGGGCGIGVGGGVGRGRG
ncbi:hypothetical protein M0804_012132 [Polistes exclamans]|nr:hypothetical protein M0804_012132 [Polistes exclamans]